MREIKFRAWDDRNLKMVFGLTNMLELWDENVDDLLNMDLMQFTNLCDKADKEIYASDILKDRNGVLWEVVWDDKDAGWGVNSLTDTGEHSECYPQNLSYGGVKIYKMEVIGNIYENPELLKEDNP